MCICVKSTQKSGDFIGRALLPLHFRMLRVTLAAPWSALVQGSKCQCYGVLHGLMRAGESIIKIVPQVPLSLCGIFLCGVSG